MFQGRLQNKYTMVKNPIYRNFLTQLRFPRQKVEFSYHVTYVKTNIPCELRDNTMFFKKKSKKNKKKFVFFWVFLFFLFRLNFAKVKFFFV